MTLGHTRRRSAVVALAAGSLAAGLISPASASAAHPREAPDTPRSVARQTILDWERIAIRTIYAPAPPTPPVSIPAGVPILGFSSVAMHDAVRRSLARPRSSEAAAAATAAHGVLRAYSVPERPLLAVELADTLAQVPEGRAKTVGIRVGRRAAARMLASRRHDGYGDPTIHYDKPATPGYWQPPATGPTAGDMLAPWLGSLRPLVVHRTVRVAGPPALTSARYAREFAQVKRLGGASGSARTQTQTDTATFFNSNSAVMVGDALIRRLEDDPLSVRRTARIFAAMHAAMTDSVIRCWELKRDIGFWRPSEAIQRAAEDGNPATEADPTWSPLVPNPPYPEYVSGHGCLTAPAVEVIRQMMGEHTSLELVSANSPTPRVFDRLRHIERQAFLARIWGGLHFRTGMVDAYRIGHKTARLVLVRLP